MQIFSALPGWQEARMLCLAVLVVDGNDCSTWTYGHPVKMGVEQIYDLSVQRGKDFGLQQASLQGRERDFHWH